MKRKSQSPRFRNLQTRVVFPGANAGNGITSQPLLVDLIHASNAIEAACNREPERIILY
jgi:hypothetical protein